MPGDLRPLPGHAPNSTPASSFVHLHKFNPSSKNLLELGLPSLVPCPPSVPRPAWPGRTRRLASAPLSGEADMPLVPQTCSGGDLGSARGEGAESDGKEARWFQGGRELLGDVVTMGRVMGGEGS